MIIVTYYQSLPLLLRQIVLVGESTGRRVDIMTILDKKYQQVPLTRHTWIALANEYTYAYTIERDICQIVNPLKKRRINVKAWSREEKARKIWLIRFRNEISNFLHSLNCMEGLSRTSENNPHHYFLQKMFPSYYVIPKKQEYDFDSSSFDLFWACM